MAVVVGAGDAEGEAAELLEMERRLEMARHLQMELGLAMELGAEGARVAAARRRLRHHLRGHPLEHPEQQQLRRGFQQRRSSILPRAFRAARRFSRGPRMF